jgi:hypothetical protein
MRDAATQQRIGEKTDTVQLDQNGGVAQENDTVCGRACVTGNNRAIGHE